MIRRRRRRHKRRRSKNRRKMRRRRERGRRKKQNLIKNNWETQKTENLVSSRDKSFFLHETIDHIHCRNHLKMYRNSNSKTKPKAQNTWSVVNTRPLVENHSKKSHKYAYVREKHKVTVARTPNCRTVGFCQRNHSTLSNPIPLPSKEQGYQPIKGRQEGNNKNSKLPIRSFSPSET